MKKHIVCFGDSNTHGYCAETGGRFDEDTRWPCLMQKALGEEYLVIEEGLNGRTTCFEDPLNEAMSGLALLAPCLKSHQPVDLLIIMLGTNDTKERFGVSAPCIASGLKRLVDKALFLKDYWTDGKPKILIVTPQNIGRRYADTEAAADMGRGCAEKSEGLAAEYEKVARLAGCHYLDANRAVSAPPNEVDYMHLTPEGHRELAEALTEKVREILSRETERNGAD